MHPILARAFCREENKHAGPALSSPYPGFGCLAAHPVLALPGSHLGAWITAEQEPWQNPYPRLMSSRSGPRLT